MGYGYGYGSNLIDYTKLAAWAKSRKGEVIFCEDEHGDYLPFVSLISLKGAVGKTSQEKIFYESHVQKIQSEFFIVIDCISMHIFHELLSIFHFCLSCSGHPINFYVPVCCSRYCTPSFNIKLDDKNTPVTIGNI
ncbi:MAG: hypothetical protein LBU18_07455 [Treponema sp.]|jgi:hypothetical protein|nr:hypothetical protein [Treponema sp.]